MTEEESYPGPALALEPTLAIQRSSAQLVLLLLLPRQQVPFQGLEVCLAWSPSGCVAHAEATPSCAMTTLLRASPPALLCQPWPLLTDHTLLHHIARSALPHSLFFPSPSLPVPALRSLPSSNPTLARPPRSSSTTYFPLPITPFSVLLHISCQCSPSFAASRRGGGTLRSKSTNSARQGFERRAVESGLGSGNANHMRDLDSFDGADLQILQGLEENAAQLEMKNAAEARTKKGADTKLSPGNVSLRSCSDKEEFDETNVTKQSLDSSAVNMETNSLEHIRSVTGNADNKKHSLDVMAVRHRGRQSAPVEGGNSGEEEIKVFEEWASMKLKEEGPSVEPVIEEMRQRLSEASEPRSADAAMEADSDFSGFRTELSNVRSKYLELPTEKDPLAFLDPTTKPIVVKRRSKVPEDWDGPGGTVVLIDKPKGWSSFAVCGKLRHMLGIKKVGHAGTLDPLSTGLLIVCVGKATKRADSYQAMTKVYSGTMRLGETTPSLDAGTSVSEVLPWEHIQEQDMQSEVETSFLGDIMQVPPMYSAIKVKGERLYTKARRGEEIVVPPRPVKIYDFQLKRSSNDRQEWNFYIVCSKGTYIRSLCADLALSLNSCAYLTALRREKIGSLNVEDAWPMEELEKYYREVMNVPFQTYKSR